MPCEKHSLATTRYKPRESLQERKKHTTTTTGINIWIGWKTNKKVHAMHLAIKCILCSILWNHVSLYWSTTHYYSRAWKQFRFFPLSLSLAPSVYSGAFICCCFFSLFFWISFHFQFNFSLCYLLVSHFTAPFLDCIFDLRWLMLIGCPSPQYRVLCAFYMYMSWIRKRTR